MTETAFLPRNLTTEAGNLTVKARSYVKSAASAGREQARINALGSEHKRIEKVSRASTGRIAEQAAAARIADRR